MGSSEKRSRFTLTSNGVSDILRTLIPRSMMLGTTEGSSKMRMDEWLMVLNYIDPEQSDPDITNKIIKIIKSITAVQAAEQKKIQATAELEQRQTAELGAIQTAVSTALTNYLNYVNGVSNGPRGNATLTTNLFGSQGKKEKKAAITFAQNVANALGKEEAHILISDFLHDPKSKFKTHSFPSYLVDRLVQIEDSEKTQQDYPGYKPFPQ